MRNITNIIVGVLLFTTSYATSSADAMKGIVSILRGLSEAGMHAADKEFQAACSKEAKELNRLAWDVMPPHRIPMLDRMAALTNTCITYVPADGVKGKFNALVDVVNGWPNVIPPVAKVGMQPSYFGLPAVPAPGVVPASNLYGLSAVPAPVATPATNMHGLPAVPAPGDVPAKYESPYATVPGTPYAAVPVRSDPAPHAVPAVSTQYGTSAEASSGHESTHRSSYGYRVPRRSDSPSLLDIVVGDGSYHHHHHRHGWRSGSPHRYGSPHHFRRSRSNSPVLARGMEHLAKQGAHVAEKGANWVGAETVDAAHGVAKGANFIGKETVEAANSIADGAIKVGHQIEKATRGVDWGKVAKTGGQVLDGLAKVGNALSKLKF